MRKSLITILFCFGSASVVLGQDPWKNVYSQHAWAKRDEWQRSDNLIRMLGLSRGSRVADIGCHEGYMTFKLAERVGNKGVVYAVDLEEQKLDLVKKRAEENSLTQIRTIKGDYGDPQLPTDSLDAAIILDAYHEMDEHDEILKHIKSALRKGGRLLICEPIADDRRNHSRAEQERRHELGMAFALADLEKAGYKIVFQKDKYVDRRKEKGDWMWVIVATPSQ